MRTLRCFLVLLLLPATLLAQLQAPRDLLAEGLSEWQGDERFWRLGGGVLVGESTDQQPCERTTYMTWTGGSVSDFDLTLDFRISGGNSGIQFRSRRGAAFAVSGYQADLEDGPNWTGGLYDQDGRGLLGRRGERVSISAQGERRAETFADADALQARIEKGGWNTYRVRAVGERIEIYVNGELFCDVIDRDATRAATSGVLAFQLQSGAPMKVEFRNIRLVMLSPDESEPGRPEWIWCSEQSSASGRMWTQRLVDVSAGLERATLLGSCDNVCRIALDGKVIAESRDWSVPFRVDVTRALEEGERLLAASCENEGGPAGLWLELQLVYSDGRERTIVTDRTWLVTADEPEDWKGSVASNPDTWRPAVSFGPLGGPPWGVPTRWSDGTGRADGESALPADQLELAEGFEAELLYSVPKATQGSWVCLTFDPRGRMIASDQYGALYRATPPPLGAADGELEVEPLPLGGRSLGHAQGLTHAFGSLYVMVALGEGIGLYRATDTDGDDEYDDVKLLKALNGGGEHGPHAVIPGPDGESLYVIAGNHTYLPEGITSTRPTPVWDEDQLLPSRVDPNGHAASMRAPAGWVCRIDPDGKEWELVAIGMRNAYDIDFDPSGELFTFDSDMEWDVGLPWYRPTRILHLVSGADFGWRTGSGKWPAHYPDSLPAVADVGLSSPTGVVFGTQAAFHAPYREAFFAADWAYGTVYAIHLEEDGASFTGTSEVFARGKPFPVTDLAIGPDGALYVTTGGRRVQSGVYRIRSTREPAPQPRGGDVSGLRAARRVIERNHGQGVPSAYWSELGSSDRFVAHAARTALEQTEAQHWAEKALSESDPAVALQALLALARVHPEAYAERVRARLAELPVDADPALLRDALRVLSLAYVRGGPPTLEEASAWSERLTPRFPSSDAAFDRELFRMLVYLEAPDAARIGVERLEAVANGPQEEPIFYAFNLRTLESGWTLNLRRRYFAWLDERAPELAGGHSLAKYIAAIREDAIARLPDELRAWQDLLAAPETTDGVPVEPAAFVRAWTADELVPLLDEVRAGRDFARGEAAYFKATCTECHRLGSDGGSTGPDLTGVGSRFGPRDILQAVLAPSETISDQYQDVEIRTTDDRVLVGRVMSEDEESLVIRVWSPAEEDVEVAAAEVALRRPHPISRMPSGLFDVLERDEILDLMAYLIAGGDADDAAFSR